MSNPAEKILVRGVNWLGDAVMSTPALQRLREARPAAEIVLLTPEKLAGLWPGHPAVDRLLTFAEEGPWALARRLRPEQFDTALVLPNSPRSALEVFLARIPVRLGYRRPWRDWFLTRTVPPRLDEVQMHKRTNAEIDALVQQGRPVAKPLPAHSHHIHQYLHLVAALGGNPAPVAPAIAVSPREVEVIRERFLASPRSASRRVIGINPGAEYGPAKRWPAENFAAAAAALARSGEFEFWILGGKGDRAIAEAVVSNFKSLRPDAGGGIRILAGETSLRELCAAVKACDVVLTNDTGPMHVAAAVGTSVVVPFGSTSWHLTGPGLPGDPRHRFIEAGAPCSPCFRRECPIDFRCMTGITVERVVEEIRSVLAARS